MSATASVNSLCAVRNAGGTNIPNQFRGSLETRLAFEGGDTPSGVMLVFDSELGVFGLGWTNSNDGTRLSLSVIFLFIVSA
jgi:hypothetical protein